MAEANWYVVHTYSGYEDKVKKDIERTAKNREIEDKILEVLVPTQTVIEVKNGKRKEVNKKLLPGYVLINMVMDKDNWYIVRNTRGVTGFVGPDPTNPVPLTEEEMQNMGVMMGEGQPKITAEYNEGDMVSVIAGVWQGTSGVVKRIDDQKQTVTINVDMFGRETPVELSFIEVKKMQ